ncbi:invasion associated locus B family protein [Cupriavidus sp. H39]|uniref:invasion associated locus B family protein n=1 Tax=Cupriavidus sp. H39 TaxID=3401635 RepID=UPI003D040A15
MKTKRFGNKIFVFLFATLATWCVNGNAAQSQDNKNAAPADSNVTRTPYGAWELVCADPSDKNSAGSTGKACDIRAAIVVTEPKTKKEGVAAVVTIGKDSVDKKSLRVAIQVPLSAALNQPVVLGDAKGEEFVKLIFVACEPQSCIAMASLSETDVENLRKLGEKINVNYANQQGQVVKVEALAKGLPEALDALVRALI